MTSAPAEERPVMLRARLMILTLGLLAGCSSEPQSEPSDLAESGEPKPNVLATPTPRPSTSKPNPPDAPLTAQAAVQSAIAKQFQIAPSTIEMHHPLGNAPLNADELDVVELVMEIEETLHVTIPDEALGTNPLKLTPARLVEIVEQARTGSEPPAQP